jgi:type I restriction enzyme S subunit
MEAVTKKPNVPALRFPGFTGEWQRIRLGDVVSISMCKRIFSDQTEPNGDVPFYKIGTLGKVADSYIPNSLFRDYRMKYNYPRPGEVLITCSGTVGYSVQFDGKDSYFQDSNIVWLSNKEENITNDFISILIKRVRWNTLSSTTIARIYGNDLRELRFLIPGIPEQEKVAAFLTVVDERFGLLKRKKELLEEYKKGVMQRLFSREIRFNDEEGNEYPEWEEKRLGEVFTIAGGRDYKHLKAGNIPVFGSSGEAISYVNEWLYEGPSVGIGRKGTIDRPIWFTGKFWTVDTLFYTTKFKSIKPEFLFQLFQSISWKKHNEASGVPSLSKRTIETIQRELPQEAEQMKIASTLFLIDEMAELSLKEIILLDRFKSGLLQKMFV